MRHHHVQILKNELTNSNIWQHSSHDYEPPEPFQQFTLFTKRHLNTSTFFTKHEYFYLLKASLIFPIAR